MKKYILLFLTLVNCILISSQDISNYLKPEEQKRLDELNAAIKKNPCDSNYLFRKDFYMSIYYLTRAEICLELALQDFQTAIPLIKDSILLTNIHYDAGNLCLVLKKLDKAYYHSCLAVDIGSRHKEKKQSPLTYNFSWGTNLGYSLCLRGLVLAEEGKTDIAMKDFQEAKKLIPASGLPEYGIGICYTKVNKNNLAIALFKEAIQINKQMFDAYSQIAKIYEKEGKYMEAINQLEIEASQMRSTIDDRIYIWIAKLYKQSGENEKACEAAKTAILYLSSFILNKAPNSKEFQSQIEHLTSEYCPN